MRLYARVPWTDTEVFDWQHSGIGEIAPELHLAWKGTGSRWLGLAWDHVGPISYGGVYDIGDPLDPLWWAHYLTAPEANALETAFDAPNGTFDGMDVAEACYWLKENDSDVIDWQRWGKVPGRTETFVLCGEGVYDRNGLLAVSRGLV